MDLHNKHIYITGSNRGMGWSMTERAAKFSAHLYLVNRTAVSDREVDKLKQLGAKSVTQTSLDMLSESSISAFMQSLQGKPVDVFINNAGLLTGGLLETQSVADIYKMFQVNLNAVVQICHGLIPLMVAQGSGYIVNNASVSGKMFFPCASTYAASKAGVVALTHSLEQELQGTGVKTLLLITPGVKTRMYKDINDLYGKNLDLSFMSSIDASEWADQVFKCIVADKAICWPKGATRFGVWLGHHFPNFFNILVKSKFKR